MVRLGKTAILPAMDHGTQALKPLPADGAAVGLSRQVLATGSGWRVVDVTYSTQPEKRPLEDQHDFVTIAEVVAGSFQYRSGHGTEMLAPGALLLGNAGSQYECSFEHSRGDGCISFNYTHECIEKLLESGPAAMRSEFRTHRIPPIPEILPLTARTAMQIVVPDVGLWEELSYAIAGDVFALLSGDLLSNRRQIRRNERHISDVLQVIECRYAQPISIAELADIACMSPYHFMRIFRDVVGVTPYQHLIRTRLRHVAVQLGTTNEPISAIAFDAGFGDLSTFAAIFRRVFDLSPGQYREAVNSGRLASPVDRSRKTRGSQAR
jgi:AraC family transcriptional regulator